MKLADALSDLADNCDHMVEPDCWYCEISQLLQEQASKLDAAQKRYEEYAGLCFACTPYLKERETPAECIQRNRNDGTQMLGMLAKERKELEAAKSRLDSCAPYLDALQRYSDAWYELALQYGMKASVASGHAKHVQDAINALRGFVVEKPTPLEAQQEKTAMLRKALDGLSE